MMTLKEAQDRYPGAATFTFGDNATLCADLLGLVRSGDKRATCGALRDFEAGGEALPVVGRHDIALNWDGSPALVIRTVEVTQRRFCDIDEDFALAEGENETLSGWQAGHRAYFERNGGWHAEMMLVCERFEMVESFDGESAGHSDQQKPASNGFVAKLRDVFEVQGKGTVLQLQLTQGVPEPGQVIETAFGKATILAVDDQGVRQTACLTGQPIPPQVAVLTDLPLPPKGQGYRSEVHSAEITGRENDV